jgi:DNA polymerase-3 subunit epsilon
VTTMMLSLTERLHLTRPIAFFDLETTGKYPERDRIVEVTVRKFLPNDDVVSFSSLVNPGCAIPAEASAVHGISDADVKDAPSFASLAPELAELLAACDLGGYNVKKFDIPLLTAEFKRLGMAFPLEGRRIIDPQIIFFQREKRDLAAAYQFFTGQTLQGAHRAGTDVDAVVAVLLGQLDRYADLPTSLDELHALCDQREPSWIDAQGKLVWVQGEACIGFGKKAGKSLRWLAANEPDYLGWIIRSDFPEDVKAIVRAAGRGKFPKQETAAC